MGTDVVEPADGWAAAGKVTAAEGVLLTSAAVQAVADAAGVRVLHLKGPAAAQVLGLTRHSSDVDVLVHPADFAVLTAALLGAGFAPVRPAWAAGGHSWDLVSDDWPAAVDVHRHFPGIEAAPGPAFETLWAGRAQVTLAGVSCQTPGRVAHTLLIGLHAARSPQGSAKWTEATAAWENLSRAEQQHLAALAQELGATAALGVRWEHFGHHTTERTTTLWDALAARDTETIWWLRLRETRHPVVTLRYLGTTTRAYLWALRARHAGDPWGALRDACGKVRRLLRSR